MQRCVDQQAEPTVSPPTGTLWLQSPTPGQWRRPRPVVSSPSPSGSRWPAWLTGAGSLGSLRRSAHDCGRPAWHASASCRSWESRRWRWGACLRGSVQSGTGSDWLSPGWAPSTDTDGFFAGTRSRSCPGRPGRLSRGARSPAESSIWCSSWLLGVSEIQIHKTIIGGHLRRLPAGDLNVSVYYIPAKVSSSLDNEDRLRWCWGRPDRGGVRSLYSDVLGRVLSPLQLLSRGVEEQDPGPPRSTAGHVSYTSFQPKTRDEHVTHLRNTCTRTKNINNHHLKCLNISYCPARVSYYQQAAGCDGLPGTLEHPVRAAEIHPVFVLKATTMHLSSGEPLIVERYQSSLWHAAHTHTHTHTHTHSGMLKLLITVSSCLHSHWQFLPHWSTKAVCLASDYFWLRAPFFNFPVSLLQST